MNQGISIPYILNEWRKNRTFVQVVSPFDPAYRGWMVGLTEPYKACMFKSKTWPVNEPNHFTINSFCRCQGCCAWFAHEQESKSTQRCSNY